MIYERSAVFDLQDLLADGLRHHQSGDLAEAKRCYRQILTVEPRHADALHLLGLIAHQMGPNIVAVDLIDKANSIVGGAAPYYSNLATILLELGRLDAAVAACHAALGRQPDLADAYSNMASVLREQDRPDAAVIACRAALRIQPDCAEAHNTLGSVLRELGHPDDALLCSFRSLVCKPQAAIPYFNLGNTLKEVRNCDAATTAYDRSLRIKPGYVEAYANWGTMAVERGQAENAIAAYKAALRLQPDSAPIFSNLGNALRDLGQFGSAIRIYTRAIHIKPDHFMAQSNLGGAMLAQGRLDDALISFQRALACKPDDVAARTNLGFTQLYRTEVGLRDILRHARGWRALYPESGSNSVTSFTSSADRPRIGFVSADFRGHAVGFLVIPAIEALARAGYDLCCYNTSLKSDALTERFFKAVSRWRPVAGLNDAALVDLIRSDRIDILFDLSGHSDGNRLVALARKPAPIQVTWVGYPATTGLPAMDYILADRYQVPPEFEAFYTEKIIRLTDSYVAFEPIADAPPISDLPLLAKGHVTFGSFNVLKKITPEVVAVWSRILARLPSSRLLMKTPSFNCPATRQRYYQLFAAHAIAPERLNLIGNTRPVEHLAWMGHADIALDSFPYAGGRTTLESLWMGLPVITLPRESFGSRHSLSYLSTLGLWELVATSVDDYVERAVALAGDTARLTALRAGLRTRMVRSRLCDLDAFTEGLDRALTTIWRRKCGGHPAASFDVY